MNKFLTLFISLALGTLQVCFAQTYKVEGVVTSMQDGEPLIGVAVMQEGTNNAAVTDLDGFYSIEIEGIEKVKLSYSFIGMTTKIIEVGPETLKLDVELEPDQLLVDEVVVVAYGVRKKGTVAGSVAAVKSEKLADVPAASFDQALQGQAPGLMVLSNSGAPNAPATFAIRGTNSINSGNQPLFILDGVPVSALDFNTINPADIESVSVLKDASSTSIYGARAANGVVVITTKRGVAMDAAKVTARAQMGISQLANNNWNLMNTAERIEYEKLIGYDKGQDYELLGKTDVNWMNEVFNNAAFLHNYDLSLNRATDKLNYFVSGNYFSQEGIAQSSGIDRYTIRANTDVKASRWLKVGTNIMTTYEELEEADEGTYSLATPISACRFMLPYWDPHKEDGSLASSNDGSWKGLGVNPIEFMKNNPIKYKKYKLLSSVYAEITFMEGLVFRSQFGLDYAHTTAFMQSFPSYQINSGIGGAGRNSMDRRNLSITNTLNYHFMKGLDHTFNLMIGQEGMDYHEEGFSMSVKGQNNDALTNISSGTRPVAWSDMSSAHSFVSFFGRAEYNYMYKYYVEASARTDASSRFGANNRWAMFGSIGLMWDMAKEDFMRNSSWLTAAQFKFSTGTSGNSSIPNFDHLALVGGGISYDDIMGIYPMQSANENLSWEKVWATNLAAHLGFFNRIEMDVEFYNKQTSDMLMAVPRSYADKGEGFVWDNVGKLFNRGVEISVNANLISTKDFFWSVNFNASYNRNRITELYNGVEEYENASTGIKYAVGHPIGEFYINRYAGVNPANGDPLWYDKDGNITNEYRESDKVMIGKSCDAPWQGGFGTALSWKGLQVSAHFSWVADRWMINNDRFFEESNGLYAAYNQSKRLLYEGWRKPGDVTDIPRFGITPQLDSRFLEDASFLRMKNLMVSYNFPAKLMKRTGFLTDFKVYAQAQNLFTITGFSGIDPESSMNVYKAQYPMTRLFTFGLEMSF